MHVYQLSQWDYAKLGYALKLVEIDVFGMENARQTMRPQNPCPNLNWKPESGTPKCR